MYEIEVYAHTNSIRRIDDVNYIDQSRASMYKKEARVNLQIAIIFLGCVLFILCLLYNRIGDIFHWFIFFCISYVITYLVCHLARKKHYVTRDFIINLRRVVSISLIAFFLALYYVMSRDSYLTQPYIDSILRVLDQEDHIEYDDLTGTYTITTKKENFKILQLTDIHLGGSIFSLSKDLKALGACYKLIEYTKPDFVVVTGDLVFPMGIVSFSLNNNAPIIQFADFMRNTGIPWAFAYGNHDTESMATLNRKEFDDLMKSISFRTSQNLLYPYVQPKIYGRNNQMIEIRKEDGSLMQAIFLLDSNDYIEDSRKMNEYDYIHEDQVAWYESKVLELSEKEGYTIPSLMFYHIPLLDYVKANELYENGSKEVKYYYGIIGEKSNDKICASRYESKLFSTAVRLGSTKAMFFGHDHYNNQSIEYKGIRMTYGYSIDYLVMHGIADDIEQRGATLIVVDKQGDYRIEPYRLMDIE